MTPRQPDDPIPAPDDEPTAAEHARARAFGDLIDRAIVGRGTPAAMSADDRALLEVATVIRGASGNLELDGDRTSSLIDAAMTSATDVDRPRSASLPPPLGAAGATRPISIERARRRWLPWSIAGVASAVAAAAIAMLVIRAPRNAAPRSRVPEALRARTTDALVGKITPDRAGDAIGRIDEIYADRLDEYRELALAGHAGDEGHQGGSR